jgi:hypothetical protein
VREAMEFAVKLIHTSKAVHSMVCNRLEVICHGDLDTLAAPHVFSLVAASLAASRDRYSKSIGGADGWQLHQTHVCRSPKPALAAFSARHRLRSMLEAFAPTIHDWANEQHTLTGRRRGAVLITFANKAHGQTAGSMTARAGLGLTS